MNVSEPFVRRPVATMLIMLGLLVFGLLAFFRLPVSALPDVDIPTITVSASLPGASPETMAASVATPLERELSAIDGLGSMTSTSLLGNTQITLQFDLERDLDSAAQDVQSAIARVSRRLPRDMPYPPYLRKVNPADEPIIRVALSSDTLPLHVVNEFAETRLAPQISTVRGVAQVQVYGSQKYAVRIRLDPDALAARSIGIDEVAKAVGAANVNLPTGTLLGTGRSFTILANGQLTRASEYRELAVAWRNGSPVRLGDLGEVLDSVENDRVAAWFVDRRAIVLAVQKQPGANAVELADAIHELLPRFAAELPDSVKLSVLFDRSDSIRESVRDVELTLLVTFSLVVMVIFVFLRRMTATLIPSVAMPLAVIGTFAVMYVLGYSVDNLSLLALTLSVGFVVDDAIVMLENVVRHMELGKPPLQAALDGSREVSVTIVSMTLSLVAVFIPFLFLGGILGRLFQEFSVTIAVAILLSGVVSLTLTPMMASRLLRPDHERRPSSVHRATERLFDGMVWIYTGMLRRVLRFKWLTLIASFAVLVATVVLLVRIPKGFLPDEDIGQISIFTEAVEGISFEALRERQLKVAELVRQDPAVENFMSVVGFRGSTNQGTLFIRLRPRGERESAVEVVARLRKSLGRLPGTQAFVQVPPQIRIGGMMTKSQYQLVLRGTELESLYRAAPLLLERLRTVPGVRDTTLDLQVKNPELRVHIDRDRAAAIGLTVEAVEDALYSAFGTRQISSIYAPDNTYAVILELAPAFQREPAALDALHVRNAAGALVPLRAVADVERGTGPLTVNHYGQLPAVTLSFNLERGYSLSEAVAASEQAALEVLPPEVSLSFQGAAQAFRDSLGGLGLLLAVAIVVIYLVLGILYESFVHPLTILTALPFAGFGAFVTLLLFRVPLDAYAFVGVILLVGLVKKNGIMMVDFAIEAQKDPACTAEAAIVEASVVRFRPIMMTTMAALLGTLPIALGLGAGAESRQPLGLAVVGGLLFSQLLTLFVTPVFYVFFEGLRRRASRRRRGGVAGAVAA
ncbi:MAG: efflux RND transporter permease subunit [Polyangiaceae bacterium]|nr:efflux RND transporter permease subunit [Polyangiaceae bacterium]